MNFEYYTATERDWYLFRGTLLGMGYHVSRRSRPRVFDALLPIFRGSQRSQTMLVIRRTMLFRLYSNIMIEHTYAELDYIDY
jgi:hypothetical protein